MLVVLDIIEILVKHLANNLVENRFITYVSSSPNSEAQQTKTKNKIWRLCTLLLLGDTLPYGKGGGAGLQN